MQILFIYYLLQGVWSVETNSGDDGKIPTGPIPPLRTAKFSDADALTGRPNKAIIVGLLLTFNWAQLVKSSASFVLSYYKQNAFWDKSMPIC